MEEEDKLIDELLLEVQKKQAEVKELKKKCSSDFKTNLSFPRTYDSSPNFSNFTNLNAITKKEDFIFMFSFLKIRKDGFDSAAKILGVDAVFSWGGYSYEEWEHDFAAKIKSLDVLERSKDLANMERELNSLMSDRSKRTKKLESLKNRLK